MTPERQNEIYEAVRLGYPKARQRREWSPEDWNLFHMLVVQKDQANRDVYEAGNSPERLRELIDELTIMAHGLLERIKRLEFPQKLRNNE